MKAEQEKAKKREQLANVHPNISEMDVEWQGKDMLNVMRGYLVSQYVTRLNDRELECG